MKLKTKYNMGQEVYYATSTTEKVMIEKCDTCNGEGMVEFTNGNKRTCPDCYGRRGQWKCFYPKGVSHSASNIGKICVEIEGDKTSVKYMIRETGIGSGTLHPEKKVFWTKDEGLEYVKQANKDMRELMKAETVRIGGK